MKKLLFTFAFALLLPQATFAIGGLAGFYAGEFGNIGSGGTSYVTPSTLSPVIVDPYNTYPVYTQSTATSTSPFIGGYSAFIASQSAVSAPESGTGGLSQYYESNPSSTYERDGVGGLTQYYETNPPTMTPSEPLKNGFADYWQTGRNNGSFDYQCRPKARPTNATCEGGVFKALKNNYGCTVDWKCEGGNYCPIARRPLASQCNGDLEPQYNGRGCLTHYFCDGSPDIPDPTPECLGSIYECSTAYRNPWLRAWGQ